MAGGTAPIGIAIRHDSASPRHSNLTSALQHTSGNEIRQSELMVGHGTNKMGSSRHDSISMSGLTPQYYSSGAVPISMNNAGRQQQRRESNAAGSMMGGMSWGGVSMSSWIRDDVVMQGASPVPAGAGGIRSPSYHSSSYLPKLEANFMKDFYCCGLVLPSLHDLLGHFELVHHEGLPMTNQQQTISQNRTVATTTTVTQHQPPHAIANLASIQSGSGSTMQNTGHDRSPRTPTQAREMQQNKSQYQPSQDMEGLEDMEMDDINGNNFDTSMAVPNMVNSGFPLTTSQQYAPQSHFAQQQGRVPPLDINVLANPMQNFQGIRQSQPGTPISAGGRPYHGNPTVSSVNTPTMTSHPRPHQQFRTPDSSTPGTPRELDQDIMGDMGSMSMDTPGYMTMPQTDMTSFNYGNDTSMGEIYIDDPAKSLYNPNAGTNQNQQTVHQRLGNAQYGPDSEIAKSIRERQRKVGLADTLNGAEPKPFRCPVIGCEKAYKNQNGLKYHKTHGHNNQQLHENPDGTYSIVDPQTLTPYPGTVGMEKEKPYKCETCQKRYKNLNGLKYHKVHSRPCNPDLKPNNTGMPINVNAPNANVAGAGGIHLGELM